MNRGRKLHIITVVAILAVLLGASQAVYAGRLARPLYQSGAPQMVSYQGQVSLDGVAYTGSGYFKFAVVNQAGDTTYWSNDGTSTAGGEPATAVSLTVSNGLFNVLLGDSTLTNMIPLPASSFDGNERSLRVWFSSDGSTFSLLSPDLRIAAVPYALQAEQASFAASAGDADTLDGQHASAFASIVHDHDASYVNEGQSDSVVSPMIVDGTPSFADMGQNGCASGQVPQWNGIIWTCASVAGVTDHGALSGLADDDHSQYFNLSQFEIVTGIPAFNGGMTGGSAPFFVDSATLVTNLNADLLDGQQASAFATAVHIHQTLTAGSGLTGGSYNGSTAATFAVSYGTTTGSAVQGNQSATITAGNGLTGGISADALGDGFAATLNLVGGSGITANADNITLGSLTSNWSQTGAFDVLLNNASSELQILESSGGTYYGTLDVGDLSSNQTYTLTTGGTLWTSGNDGAGSYLDADQLDGLHAQQLSYWALGGNAGTTPGTHFLGTMDNQALEVRVNNYRALRLEPNFNSPNLIGGFSSNSVTSGAYGASVGGGGSSTYPNLVTDDFGTVGGGLGNLAGDNDATTTDSAYNTVGGGNLNTASGATATVAGGYTNTASGATATVGGGGLNTASGLSATIAGGYTNNGIGNYATVSGGATNIASGVGSSISGGFTNTSSGYMASVAGGELNLAQGMYSFAAGYKAKAYNDGCFVWADNSNFDLSCSTNNAWVARASGGVHFYTDSNSTSGVYVAAGGGSWSSVSDRNLKENIALVDGREVLELVAALPVSTWNYTAQSPSIRHMGPMAQDFAAAFGVGEDDTHITTIDADGVALAAIQGLYAENQALKADNARQQAQIEAIQQQAADLEARLRALEDMSGVRRVATAGFDLPLIVGTALVILYAGFGLGMAWLRRWRER